MQPPPIPIDKKALNRVAELLAKAKKPIMYVGQGANDAPEELMALAEAAQIPFTTTLHAMGVMSEHHAHSMHMLGMHGAAYANYAIQESDLIIAIGSRFDDRTTGVLNKYAPVAKEAHENGTGGFVHFDIEPSQIGRVVNPTIAVAGDAKHALQQLVPIVQRNPAVNTADRAGWLQRCVELKKEFPFQ